MFWSSVVEAASLLSRPSDPLPFLLSLSPSLWFLSFTAPYPFLHPAPKHLSYLTFERFLPICSGFCLPNFSFLFLSLFFISSPSPSNLVLLSVHQDKLSEEVQKQRDGPEENGSLPATQTEPDSGLPPNADPDASQAEEDKDKTKPLLERLKALEVTTSPPGFSFFSLSLLLWLSLYFLSLYPPSFCFVLLRSCLFILLRIHT